MDAAVSPAVLAAGIMPKFLRVKEMNSLTSEMFRIFAGASAKRAILMVVDGARSWTLWQTTCRVLFLG